MAPDYALRNARARDRMLLLCVLTCVCGALSLSHCADKGPGEGLHEFGALNTLLFVRGAV